MDMPTTSDIRIQQRLRRARREPLVWILVLGVVLVIGLIAVGWLLVTWQAAAVLMVIPALVPLSIVWLAVHWLDRWEPEPPLLLALCFLWGGGASILGTLLVGNFLLEVAASSIAKNIDLEAFSLLVQGPFIEELMKSLGVVIVLLIAWREVHGLLDGFVYAAMVGSGFAFTENIVYFASSGSTGLDFVWLLVVRGILSPFAHVVFTGALGLALGWAVKRREPLHFVIAGVLGTLVAVGLHSMWNGGSLYLLPLIGVDPNNPFAWIISYAVFQLPLFLAFAYVLVQLQYQDQEIIRLRLGEYRRAGWFTASEVRMIANWNQRQAALKWSKQQSPEIHAALLDFVRDATSLAFAREHAANDKRDKERRTREKELLQRTREDRNRLNALTSNSAA
nr:PrsW family intramembrane metalloprotease [Pseudoclavibacter sp. Marseille-Q3772]